MAGSDLVSRSIGNYILGFMKSRGIRGTGYWFVQARKNVKPHPALRPLNPKPLNRCVLRKDFNGTCTVTYVGASRPQSSRLRGANEVGIVSQNSGFRT